MAGNRDFQEFLSGKGPGAPGSGVPVPQAAPSGNRYPGYGARGGWINATVPDTNREVLPTLKGWTPPGTGGPNGADVSNGWNFATQGLLDPMSLVDPGHTAPMYQQNSQPTIDDQIAQLIAQMGSAPGVDMKSIQSSVNGAYSPAFAAIDKLRGANKKQNAKDVGDVLNIYKMLSGDYTKTAGSTAGRYDKQIAKTGGDYSKSTQDTNARYDQEIADMTKQLTALGQTQLIDSEAAKINKQRNQVLDNLTQSGNTSKDSYSHQKQAITDFFNAGSVGAGLQGADQASRLKMALQKALMGLDQNQMQLEQSRAGDVSKAYSSARSASNDNVYKQIQSLLGLKSSQRQDAQAAYDMSKPAAGAYKNTDNVYGRANNYLDSVGASPTAKQLFQDFVQSDGSLVNQGLYNPQTGRNDPITVPNAVKLAQNYARDHHLSSQDAALLISTAMQAYK